MTYFAGKNALFAAQKQYNPQTLSLRTAARAVKVFKSQERPFHL
jgi:hypothetical protein